MIYTIWYLGGTSGQVSIPSWITIDIPPIMWLLIWQCSIHAPGFVT